MIAFLAILGLISYVAFAFGLFYVCYATSYAMFGGIITFLLIAPIMNFIVGPILDFIDKKIEEI